MVHPSEKETDEMGAATTVQLATGATFSLAAEYGEAQAMLLADDAAETMFEFALTDGRKATFAGGAVLLIMEEAAAAEETTKHKIGFC